MRQLVCIWWSLWNSWLWNRRLSEPVRVTGTQGAQLLNIISKNTQLFSFLPSLRRPDLMRLAKFCWLCEPSRTELRHTGGAYVDWNPSCSGVRCHFRIRYHLWDASWQQKNQLQTLPGCLPVSATDNIKATAGERLWILSKQHICFKLSKHTFDIQVKHVSVVQVFQCLQCLMKVMQGQIFR